jgi:hypothetical protein
MKRYCNQKRGTLFTCTWMIEPRMQTRPILIYSATLRPPKPKWTPDRDRRSFQQTLERSVPSPPYTICKLKHTDSSHKTFLAFNYISKYMSRAQALGSSSQKPQISFLCTDTLYLLLKTSAAKQTLRTPDAAEKKISNRPDLLYYSSKKTYRLPPHSANYFSFVSPFPHLFFLSSLLLLLLLFLLFHFPLVGFSHKLPFPFPAVPFLLTDLDIIARRRP